MLQKATPTLQEAATLSLNFYAGMPWGHYPATQGPGLLPAVTIVPLLLIPFFRKSLCLCLLSLSLGSGYVGLLGSSPVPSWLLVTAELS